MKKIGVLLLVFCMVHNALFSQWEVINQAFPIMGTPNIDFINKTTGWIAYNDYNRHLGFLYKTIDGGKSWQQTYTIEQQEIHSFDFVNDSLGWMVISDSIYKTHNGGKSWIPQLGGLSYTQIHAINDSVVFLKINGPKLLKTVNGGSSWIDIDIPTISAYYNACFLDADNVIIEQENTIYRTQDGGNTWDEKTFNQFNSVTNFKYINDSILCFIACTEEDRRSLCKTNNGFIDFEVLIEKENDIKDYVCFNDSVILAHIRDSVGACFVKSTNGGISWVKSYISTCSEFSLYKIDENTVYYSDIGFNSYVILKSTDQGNEWTSSLFSSLFTDIYFVNKNTGFILGSITSWGTHSMSAGYIFMTTEGGKIWKKVFNGNNTSSFLMTSVTNGFFLNGNELKQTVDGGNNWFTNPIGYPLSGIFFINESTGYIHDACTILKTIDGGTSWDTCYNNSLFCDERRLNGIYFIDENLGWAVGESGVILKFKKEEGWTEISSGTTVPLNKVFFIDKTTGWIMSSFIEYVDTTILYHCTMLKTTDGGENWKSINSEFYLKDFYFKNTQHGWAVGELGNSYNPEFPEKKGVILETSDGGENWNTIEPVFVNASLNSIQWNSNYIWAAGDNGLIMRLYDTDTTSSNPDFEAVHSSIQFQTYPNPFTSSTIISYQLAFPNEIELNIYDILGRKVTNLVKEPKAVGSYEVEWNASGMNSGIYFCELKAGLNSQVIKMVLMK